MTTPNRCIVRGVATLVVAILATGAASGQPGFLDPTFAGTGLLRFGVGGMDDQGQAATVQSDGKIVVAGLRYDYSYQIVLMRLGTNNLPDPTFGVDGFAAVTPPYFPENVSTVLQQTDGKLVVAATENGPAVFGENPNRNFLLARFNADGSLDTAFGSNGTGFVEQDYNDGDDLCVGMVLQPDGKIVVAGTTTAYAHAPYTNFMVLERFETNGTPDASFGSAGAYFGSVSTFAGSVVLDGYGNILVGGEGPAGQGVFRITTNGVPDTTFGTGGECVIAAANSQISALAIQPAGVGISQPELILAGSFSGTNVLLARVTVNGALDTSFNGVGYVTAQIGSGQFEWAGLRVFGSWSIVRPFKYVIAGWIYNSDQFALARFNVNGAPDTSFGSGGVALTSIPGETQAQAYSLAVPAGLLLVAGTSSIGGSCPRNITLVQYHYADGSLDTNFNGSGVLVTNGSYQAQFNAVGIQSDGKIVLAGFAANSCSGQEGIICRLNPDGSFDPGFGNGGILRAGAAGTSQALVIQPDGRILVAGAGSAQLIRLLTNGVLDTSFGAGGQTNLSVVTNFSPAALALQGDRKILVAGRCNENGNDIAIVRLNPDGSLDPSWNGTGALLTIIGSNGDYLFGAGVQSDGKLVSAGSSIFPSTDKFSMLRCNTNGALDNSFGYYGRVATGIFGEQYSLGEAMALQPDNKVILAGEAVGGAGAQIALLRYTTNGALDPSFGANGLVLSSIGLGDSYAVGAAVQGDGKIVTACRAQIWQDYKFASARFLNSGAPDPTYGVGGANYYDFGASTNEQVNAMALDPVGRLVLAGSTGSDFAVARVSGNPLLRFISITALTNHHIFLTGLAVPDASNTLLKASAPRAPFAPLTHVFPDASGFWQYDDGSATNSTLGFYRLSYP